MGQQCIMNKLNKILDIIFIVSMIGSTVAFGITATIFEPGKLLGDLFCLLVIVLLCGTIGLCIQPIESSKEPTEYDQWDGDESDKISY